MKNVNAISFLILIFAVSITVGQASRHGICERSVIRNEDRVYLKIFDCPSAVANLKKGINQTICRISENVLFVCCSPNTTSILVRDSISIVNEMCNKYKEAQFKLSIPGEELSDEPIDKETINNCFELGLIPESRPEIKKYPHMALIGYGESKSNVRWLCAGTLISERYILTAAHCVRSANVRPAKWIRLGESNYKTSSENNVGLMDFGIAAQITHPNYSIRIVYNDIALIKLDRNVPFSAYTRPLCLDTSSRPIESKAVAISWDLANEEYRENVHLLEMNLPLIPISRCKEILGNSSRYPTGIDEKSQICTNYQFNDENIWSDSDGPLQLRLNSEPCMHIQIGISSFGNAFYRLNEIPVVYTKVYNYLDWIQNIVWPQ